jgi:lipopolysaccharide export system permease protein
MVEVHKKWALSLACFPFVLLAVALALRFPRGGMGLVIGGAMFVYAVFYVGLTAGESLADRQLISPAVAMWSPNAILLVLAVAGLVSVHRESGSTRGGDLHEIGDFFRRLVPRRRR